MECEIAKKLMQCMRCPDGCPLKGKEECIDRLKEITNALKKIYKNGGASMNRKDICECTQCERGRSCYMYEKFQRLPRSEGGLGLCPKLAFARKPEGGESK